MRYIGPFLAGLFGEERRTFNEINDVPLPQVISHSEHIFGIKGGVQVQLGRYFMLAPALGVSMGDEVSGDFSAEMFADFELNFTMGGGYIGTGYSYWAFTDDNLRANAIMLQFGVPLTRHSDGRGKFLFVGEGRYFVQEHSFKNNYQYWGGLRYVFR